MGVQWGQSQDKTLPRTSLMVQWMGTGLPIQETQVRSLVREDPTYRRAAKLMPQNYRVHALEPMSRKY